MVRGRREVAFMEPNQVMSVQAVQSNPPSWGLSRISQRDYRTRNTYMYPDTAGADVDVSTLLLVSIIHFM